MQYGVMHTRTSPITKFRKANDRMTLEEFGRLLKPQVDKSTISRWERSRVPAERMGDVASLIGVPIEQLRPDIFKAKSKKRRSTEREGV